MVVVVVVVAVAMAVVVAVAGGGSVGEAGPSWMNVHELHFFEAEALFQSPS